MSYSIISFFIELLNFNLALLFFEINLESKAAFSIFNEHPRSSPYFNIHLPVPLSSALSSIISNRNSINRFRGKKMKQTMITLTFKNQEKFVISGDPEQSKDFRLPKFKHDPKRKNNKRR